MGVRDRLGSIIDVPLFLASFKFSMNQLMKLDYLEFKEKHNRSKHVKVCESPKTKSRHEFRKISSRTAIGDETPLLPLSLRIRPLSFAAPEGAITIQIAILQTEIFHRNLITDLGK